MARIRTSNELILSQLDFYRVAQPLLDTKPGTVARDLVIDGPSTQVARVYDELDVVSKLQSLRQAIGIDLDKWAQNYGLVRQRGSKSTGPGLFTFNTLETDFAITKGDIVTARNGATFVVLNSITVSKILANNYRAIASRFRSDLDFVGITDTYAVEVLLESTAPGVQGNISKYSLTSTSIVGVSNVTNASPFGGGKASENDATFRSRILAVFSGANTGTATGYENAVKADPAVIDVLVIEPGDPLMTRDGTQVKIAEDGTRTILSEGTGGKVDVIVFGTRLSEITDSFVYRDLSNTGKPTHINNDFILGQIAEDKNKTITKRRLDNLKSGVLPAQPVNNLIQVSGSISGSNFVEKTVDELGRISGNYELIKDTGAYGGSPWGSDKLRWISDRISDLPEDKTKIAFNGQDPLSFSDVLEIKKIQQNISITNENAKISASDRSSLQLAHFPVSNVTRVFNVTTGERYVVASQNPDGTGSTNETGRIIISGKSLPAVSDILQVDYTWVFSFDPYFDFDNRVTNNNPRTVTDSIDWGYSNAVRREKVTLMSSGSFLSATVTHNISSVVAVNVVSTGSATIGLTSGRLSVTVSSEVKNVVSIIRNSDNAELWNTNKSDGTFSGLTIFFPTDTVAVINNAVTITYNATDVYNADTQGSFSGNKMTIVPSSTAVAGTIVEATYIADVSTILPGTLLSSLPAIKSSNNFKIGTTTGIGNQPTSHIFYESGLIYSNLRQGPSNLVLTMVGSISPGIITVTGTTMSAIVDMVFTNSSGGLKLDLSSAIKNFLKLTSKDSVPSNVRIVKVSKVEKVTTTSNLDVLSVSANYDIKGYYLFDNSFVKDDAIADSSLKLYEVRLPSTTNNNNNSPSVGNRIRVRIHIATTSDSENVSFSRSGTLYTNKKFALIDTIAISSGFTSGSSASATLTITNLNQPATRSRYKAFYDYLAPKTNERITIRYNQDKIIEDSTLALEATRPINADVLAKSATGVQVDVTMNIVVTKEFEKKTNIVLQNVFDAITAALNPQQLETIVDSSDLVNTAYTVNGVDRARVIFFNKSGKTASTLSVTAQKNEFIIPGTVNIVLESR